MGGSASMVMVDYKSSEFCPLPPSTVKMGGILVYHGPECEERFATNKSAKKVSRESWSFARLAFSLVAVTRRLRNNMPFP